jgi:hypothetical protein
MSAQETLLAVLPNVRACARRWARGRPRLRGGTGAVDRCEVLGILASLPMGRFAASCGRLGRGDREESGVQRAPQVRDLPPAPGAPGQWRDERVHEPAQGPNEATAQADSQPLHELRTHSPARPRAGLPHSYSEKGTAIRAPAYFFIISGCRAAA